MVTRQPGFGLVEVIVAAALLGVAVISIAGSAAFSVHVLGVSEDHESAARISEGLLDSLAVARVVSAGSRDDGRFHAEWTVSNGGVVLHIAAHDARGMAPLSFAQTLTPALDTLPCTLCK